MKELWIDGNRIKSIPDWIGNLRDLVHLEASVNHIDFVSDRISNCRLVQELALCTNDLRSLPEAIGGLESLVTLKIDDNQVLFLADTFSLLLFFVALIRGDEKIMLQVVRMVGS